MEAAVAYIRVSGQRQVDEGGSLDSQLKQVIQYAALNGYDLVRVFREEGESAKNDQRPRLQEMLRFCREKKNKVSLVIFPKIDRIARNVDDYSDLKRELKKLGIRMESLGERLENNPVGRFMEMILASVAQFDNEIRAERSKGGMMDAVAQGRWVWKAPIGYRNVRFNGKGTIEPDPKAAPIVQDAFRQLAYGQEDRKAVRDSLAKSGFFKNDATFYRLFQNEAYIGRIRAFGKVFLAKPPFTPLVDEITFYKAQAALKPTNVPKQYQMESEDFPLRGSMVCACGSSFTGAWSLSKTGKRYGYYRCVHCNSRSYPRDQVHRSFELFLSLFKHQSGAWERVERILIAHEKKIRSRVETSVEESTNRIQALLKLQDGVAQKNALGVIPDDVAKRQLETIASDLRLAAESLHMKPEGSVAELLEFARQFCEELGERWAAFSAKSKKDLLRFMFPEGILYHPESGFRTHGSSLSELFHAGPSDVNSLLVDPSAEFSNSLHKWLSELHAIIAREEGYLAASTLDTRCK